MEILLSCFLCIIWKQELDLQPAYGNAPMAELVDALVSNTSVFTDMPVRARLGVLSLSEMRGFFCFDITCFQTLGFWFIFCIFILLMSRISFILIFLTCFGFSKAQKYTQNIPFDTTLCSGTYTVYGGCTATYPLKIQLSSSLFSYVSGMKFMVIIDSVNFGGPMSMCPVKPGDTTVLNSANPTFSTISVSGLKYWFRIELAGTPTVAGQSYPCYLQISQCLCFCTDITIKPSTTNTSICSVDLNNSINELNSFKSISVFPNPAGNLLCIKNVSGPTDISIYDNYGKLVFSKHLNAGGDFDISHLAAGAYSLFLSDENKKITTTKLMIEK
jgi:hypothetical protein